MKKPVNYNDLEDDYEQNSSWFNPDLSMQFIFQSGEELYYTNSHNWIYAGIGGFASMFGDGGTPNYHKMISEEDAIGFLVNEFILTEQHVKYNNPMQYWEDLQELPIYLQERIVRKLRSEFGEGNKEKEL